MADKRTTAPAMGTHQGNTPAIPQATTTQTSVIALAEVVTDRADELSTKLYALTEIVKLASFAAEARRTLTAIRDVTEYRPEMREAIDKNVLNAHAWLSLEDCVGEVLHGVARELDRLNGDHVDALYALTSTAAKKGGAL